jgi:hypothetical protein
MSSPEGGKRVRSDFPKQKSGCSAASASVYDKDTGKNRRIFKRHRKHLPLRAGLFFL